MKNMKKKSILLLISVAVLLIGAVGATVAYLTTQTTPIENTFTPAEVGVEVDDDVAGHIKKNVTVRNTKDVPVYVRVAVVANWCDANGNIMAYGEDASGNPVTPWNEYDKIEEAAGSKWTYHNGYFYYSDVVNANTTVTFFDEYAAPAGPDGAHLEMDIIAQAIQAEPTDAVEEAWDFIPGGN